MLTRMITSDGKQTANVDELKDLVCVFLIEIFQANSKHVFHDFVSY